MKPLYLCKEYETISYFGHSDFLEELNNQYPIDQLRIKGFRRLIRELNQLIKTALFSIKNKKDREELISYSEELMRFWKVLPTLFRYKKDQSNKTQTLVIIEENFGRALDRVGEIRSLINDPLNRNDLIFSYVEQPDIKAVKRQILKNFEERG